LGHTHERRRGKKNSEVVRHRAAAKRGGGVLEDCMRVKRWRTSHRRRIERGGGQGKEAWVWAGEHLAEKKTPTPRKVKREGKKNKKGAGGRDEVAKGSVV